MNAVDKELSYQVTDVVENHHAERAERKQKKKISMQREEKHKSKQADGSAPYWEGQWGIAA